MSTAVAALQSASAVAGQASLGTVDWGALVVHFLGLSLLSVGGAISTAPDMHRILVGQHGWITDAQFNASIALAQAAPGPNVLFVALMGWHVGLNTGGGLAACLLGVACAMAGILIPSTTLTWATTRWAHNNRTNIGVRAFKAGMAPVVIGLLLATGWVLAAAHPNPQLDWPVWLAGGASALLVWRTKVHMLMLLAIGGALGALGWI